MPEPSAPAAAVPRPAVWPDDAARALAVQFVWAHLSHTPDDAGVEARAVTEFASPDVASELVPRFDERGPRQVLRSAVVAGIDVVDDRRALVAVASTMAGPRATSRLIAVPVARDGRGGLVVFDLPALAAAPARAAAGRMEGEALVGEERAAVEDVLVRFFRAFLAGDADGLEYLVPPGTRMSATPGGLELVDLASIVAAGPASPQGPRAVGHCPGARRRAASDVRAALPATAGAPGSLVRGRG